jgi:anti-sigma-K factor RskA
MTVELHTLTGAYAAHALSADEVDDFEAHLSDCADCRQETRELVATAARIGEAEYDAPPPALKARVMAEIAQTRQLPPIGGVGDTSDPSDPSATDGTVVDLSRRRRSRFLLGVAASVAALALVGGGIAGGIALHERSQTHQVESDAKAIARVLSAPDARTVTAAGPDGSHGTAVVSDSQHSAVFSAADWPAPPSGKVYQLWVIDSAGARSAGLLQRSPDGSVSPVVTTDVPAANANFGVTLEPAGGSKQPTATPVLLLPMQA